MIPYHHLMVPHHHPSNDPVSYPSRSLCSLQVAYELKNLLDAVLFGDGIVFVMHHIVTGLKQATHSHTSMMHLICLLGYVHLSHIIIPSRMSPMMLFLFHNSLLDDLLHIPLTICINVCIVSQGSSRSSHCIRTSTYTPLISSGSVRCVNTYCRCESRASQCSMIRYDDTG